MVIVVVVALIWNSRIGCGDNAIDAVVYVIEESNELANKNACRSIEVRGKSEQERGERKAGEMEKGRAADPPAVVVVTIDRSIDSYSTSQALSPNTNYSHNNIKQIEG